MAFDSFNSPSSDFYGRTQFADSVGGELSTISKMVGDAVANKSYVLAAKRAAQYREDREAELFRQQQEQQERSSRGGLFGALAGAATSLIPGVGPFLAPVASAAVGSLASRA